MTIEQTIPPALQMYSLIESLRMPLSASYLAPLVSMIQVAGK